MNSNSATKNDSVLGLLDTKKLARRLGFTVNTKEQTGKTNPQAQPRGFSVDHLKYQGSLESISDQQNQATTSDRAFKLTSYYRMDAYGGLISEALNTFANETLGINKSFLPSIRFTMNDAKLEKKVKRCLEINDVLKNTKLKNNVRTLCQFGDFSYIIDVDPSLEDVGTKEGINYLKESQDILQFTDRVARMGSNGEYFTEEITSVKTSSRLDINEQIFNKKSRISDPFEPEELMIRFLEPKNYLLKGYHGQIYRLILTTQTQVEYQPWSFVTFYLEDRDSFPYGKSILEPARLTFESLIVAENLMQLSRSSKVQRMVIKLPQGGSDSITDFERFASLRSSLENTRWQNGFNAPWITRNSDTSLKTIIYTTDDVKFEMLEPQINVSDIEDIKYWEKKLLTCLGLPRSYFLADDTNIDIKGTALEEQDLAFACKLPAVQAAIVEGYEKLITLVAYYLGANLDTLKVSVTINSPHRLNTKYVEQYRTGLELVRDELSLIREIYPDLPITGADLSHLIFKIGLDPEVLNIPSLVKSGSTSSTGQIEPGQSANLGGDRGFEGFEGDVGEGPVEDAGSIPSEVTNESRNYSEKPMLYPPIKITEANFRNSHYVDIGSNVSVHARLYNGFVSERGLG